MQSSNPFNCRDLYDMPEIKFTGETKEIRFSDKDPLIYHTLGILRGENRPCPQTTHQQWCQLLSLLTAHWIKPLLYFQSRQPSQESSFPKEIAQQLRLTFLHSQGRAMQMEQQLAEIAPCFEKNHIPLIVLKGPALARTVYPHPATRPSSDLDLLVRPGDMGRARELLIGLHYTCLGKRFEIAQDFYNDELFIKRGNGYRQVELHWALHRFAGIVSEMPVQAYFDRAVPVNCESFSFFALDPIDALIHRCISNTYDKDLHMRLIWLTDIVCLSSTLRSVAQWREFQTRCVQTNARLPAQSALSFTKNWLGLNMPDEVDNFDCWPPPTQTELDAWRKLEARHRNLVSLFRLHLAPNRPLTERLRYFLHLLFPSRQYMSKAYGRGNSLRMLVAYIKRWLKWLRYNE